MKLPNRSVFSSAKVLTIFEDHLHQGAVVTTTESGLTQDRFGQFEFSQYDARSVHEKNRH